MFCKKIIGIFSVFEQTQGGFGFQSQTSCLLLPPRLRVARRIVRRIFFTQELWFESFPMTLHFGAEQKGFGVPVANILFAPSTPASALPARPAPDFFTQGYRLGVITATLRFESPNGLQSCKKLLKK